jgi:hypothetical protein
MVQTKHGVLRRSAGLPVIIHIATILMGESKLAPDEALSKAQLLIDTYNEAYIMSQETKHIEIEQVESNNININNTTCMLSGDSDA